MGKIKTNFEKKERFYLFSKVILDVSKVRHLPHLPPLRYGHAIYLQNRYQHETCKLLLTLPYLWIFGEEPYFCM
jgi:hypothetical protein